MRDFRHALRRCARYLQWTLCIAVILFGVKYCFEASARASADDHPEETWTEISTVQGVSYTATRTFISNDTILLRLYQTGASALLAERTYQKHGVALRWTEDKLIYDTYLDDGGIQLPPTWLDEFLAKLP